jgi:hypothetical protein
MTSSPSRIRHRVAFAFATALLSVGGCSSGPEPVGTVASSRRDVPPTWRQPPGATRESPGTTREPPGPGREPPSGGTGGTGDNGGGGGGQCMACPAPYACTDTTGDGSFDFTLDLKSRGGECRYSNTANTAVFHCDGTVSLSGDITDESTWTASADGGFSTNAGGSLLVCHPAATTPGTAP